MMSFWIWLVPSYSVVTRASRRCLPPDIRPRNRSAVDLNAAFAELTGGGPDQFQPGGEREVHSVREAGADPPASRPIVQRPLIRGPNSLNVPLLYRTSFSCEIG